MSVIKTGSNSVTIAKPTYIVLTEFLGTETGAAEGDSYIIEEVIRDTTSISQDDNDETEIERETSDIPIQYIMTLGDYSFEAEVANISSEVLKALCGYTVGDDGTAYAPTVYTDKYVQIDVALPNADGSLTAVTLYKVKLASKLLIESLNSNPARISLAGKAMTLTIDGEDRVIAINPNYTVPTEGTE